MIQPPLTINPPSRPALSITSRVASFTSSGLPIASRLVLTLPIRQYRGPNNFRAASKSTPSSRLRQFTPVSAKLSSRSELSPHTCMMVFIPVGLTRLTRREVSGFPHSSQCFLEIASPELLGSEMKRISTPVLITATAYTMRLLKAISQSLRSDSGALYKSRIAFSEPRSMETCLNGACI